MTDQLANLESENQKLQERLKQIKQLQKKTTKQKMQKKLQPFSQRNFESHKKKNNAQSKIDYEYNLNKRKEKEQLYEKFKEQLELDGCTFQPEINKVSKNLIDDYRVPIYERKPINYKEIQTEQPLQNEEDQIEELEQKKKIPKKINKEFYNKQMEWNRQKQAKINEIKVQKTLKDMENKGQPKINKKKNKQLVHQKGTFLDRIQMNLNKKEQKQKALDQKYYNHRFKPKTNKNITASSKVQQELEYIFDNQIINRQLTSQKILWYKSIIYFLNFNFDTMKIILNRKRKFLLQTLVKFFSYSFKNKYLAINSGLTFYIFYCMSFQSIKLVNSFFKNYVSYLNLSVNV